MFHRFMKNQDIDLDLIQKKSRLPKGHNKISFKIVSLLNPVFLESDVCLVTVEDIMFSHKENDMIFNLISQVIFLT